MAVYYSQPDFRHPDAPFIVTGTGMVGNLNADRLDGYHAQDLIDMIVGGSGSVTSVGLALPSIFTVSGSPVTTAGTLTGSLATQVANTIFAGPTTGADAAPTFRILVAADIPAHTQAWSTITATPTTLAGYGITDSVPSGRLINTTAPLAGGGDLSADRTLTTSMATARLIGRTTAGTGVMEEITVGTGLSLSAGALTSTVVGLTDGDKGDVTVSTSGATWTIDPNAVSFAKMQAVSVDILLGNDAAGTAVQEIACTAAGRALLDDADAAAQRTTLGLVIGTNVQAFDAQLSSIAGLAYAGNTLKVVRVNAGETDFELATLSDASSITTGVFSPDRIPLNRRYAQIVAAVTGTGRFISGTGASTTNGTLSNVTNTEAPWLNIQAVGGGQAYINSQADFRPDHDSLVDIVARTGGSVLQCAHYVGFSATGTLNGAAGGAPNESHAVFWYDPAVHGTAFWRVSSGTLSGTRTETTTTIAVAAGTTYRFTVRMTASQVQFWQRVGSTLTLIATHTTTLPTSTTAHRGQVSLDELEFVAKDLLFSRMSFMSGL